MKLTEKAKLAARTLGGNFRDWCLIMVPLLALDKLINFAEPSHSTIVLNYLKIQKNTSKMVIVNNSNTYTTRTILNATGIIKYIHLITGMENEELIRGTVSNVRSNEIEWAHIFNNPSFTFSLALVLSPLYKGRYKANTVNSGKEK